MLFGDPLSLLRRAPRPGAGRGALALSLLPLAAALLVLLAGCGRSEPRAAAAPLPALEYIGQWGSRGDAPGQLRDPVGPAVDAIGRVYFADRAAGSVEKFEAAGVPLLTFVDPLVRNPAAIAVDQGGAIYVADIEAGRIEIFWPEGDHLRSLHLPPQRSQPGPFSFAVDALGQIFVPNPAAGEIVSMDRRGRIEAAWKMPPSVSSQPSHPSLVEAAPGGGIFAGDARSGEIVKYVPVAGGHPATAFSDNTSTAAPLLSMAASAKYLFVLRDAEPCLEVWTLDGHLRFRDNLGGRLAGAPDGQAGYAGQPTSARPSLGVTPQGELIVLDPAGPRVLRFRIHLDVP